MSGSTRRLSEVVRHLVVPKGIVSTAWPSVRDTCSSLGIGFDGWQHGAGQLIVGKDEHGLYATDTVVISIPRQVGKTYLIGWIVFALCLIYPNLTVIWTAHRYKTAGETFKSMKAMAARPKLAAHVEKVLLGAGDQSIEFKNGSRILFGARERGFGRGFSEVDVLIFDEAQILTQNAIDDMIPATNAAQNPLIVYLGTPPKPADPGEVFAKFRERALAGEADDVLYIEIGAEFGTDPLDRARWSEWNPSYPHRTPERAILRMWKNLTRDSFLREAMGMWDDEGRLLVIPLAAWSALGDTSEQPAPMVGQLVLGVDSDLNRSVTTIVAAGSREVGAPLVEVTQDAALTVDNRPGVDWALGRLLEICSRNDVVAVMIDERSAASTLIAPLRAAGVYVKVTNTVEYTRACGDFYDTVTETQALAHLDDPLFVAALKAAGKRNLGDAWAWDKRNPTAGDITPLVAATLALAGYRTLVAVADATFTAPQRLR